VQQAYLSSGASLLIGYNMPSEPWLPIQAKTYEKHQTGWACIGMPQKFSSNQYLLRGKREHEIVSE
jgi:hypothetical protein